MSKICFPHYKKGEFKSLADVVEFIGAESYSTSRYALRDIVLYTPCYRNHLRRHGVEDLIVRLFEEAPQLKDAPVLLHRLRSWAEESILADYDICCYNIKDKVTIMGHTFNGLKDVRKHIECSLCHNTDALHLGPTEGKTRCVGVHVGCHFESYPCWNYPNDDSRICENYIFRSQPITQSNMMDVLCAPHEMDFRKDHEEIAKEWLPLLYYPGVGNYMFVVANREE